MIKIEFNPAYENARLTLNLVTALLGAEESEDLTVEVKVSLDNTHRGPAFRLDSSLDQRTAYIVDQIGVREAACQVIFSTSVAGPNRHNIQDLQYSFEEVNFSGQPVHARSEAANQIVNWLLGRERSYQPPESTLGLDIKG